MLIEFTSGYETFNNPTGSTRISVWVRPPNTTEDIVAYNSYKSHAKDFQLQTYDYWNASQRDPKLGKWFDTKMHVKPGTIMTVKIDQRKFKGLEGNASLALALLARESAALIRVTVPLIGHPEASKTKAFIEGRFDVLPVEYMESLGIHFSHLKMDDFDFAFHENAIKITTLEPATQALVIPRTKTLTTISGKKVVIADNRKRRINLKRKD